jgi:hypothetical protein
MHLCTCFSKVQSSLFGILLVTPLLSRLGLGAVISDLNRVKPLRVDGQKTTGAALVSKHRAGFERRLSFLRLRLYFLRSRPTSSRTYSSTKGSVGSISGGFGVCWSDFLFIHPHVGVEWFADQSSLASS